MRASFCCKQKTAYGLRISDWSSGVCSSDLSSAAPASADDTLPPGPPPGPEEPILDPGERRGQARHRPADENGRASCRDRVCQYVKPTVVSVSLIQKTHHTGLFAIRPLSLHVSAEW